MTKRKIFNEMREGVAAMKRYRNGKITLRHSKVGAPQAEQGRQAAKKSAQTR